jgi:ribosomal protein S18 acetylase RimI-like enzyme
MNDPHLLDNPVRASLAGSHAGLAEVYRTARRYPVDVSPFTATADQPDEESWRDVAALTGGGHVAVLVGLATPVPPGWEVVREISGVQMVDSSVVPAEEQEAVRLGPSDVPEMLDLVARTQPGPFLTRTVELGSYLGIRRGGALVAMAGERLHPPGLTEISAVCTDPEFRGQGFGTRLVLAVASGIHRRGETPFLHVTASNTSAIRLYESLGFVVRRAVKIVGVRIPGTAQTEIDADRPEKKLPAGRK